MEVESALVDYANMAEAAVIGKQHEIMVRLAHHDPEALEGSKGQAICAFVTLKGGFRTPPLWWMS